MPRVIVMLDADHLYTGVEDTTDVLMAELVEPAHLEDLAASEQFLERLEWAVRGVPKGHEDYRRVSGG